jgi:hypothetical protein
MGCITRELPGQNDAANDSFWETCRQSFEENGSRRERIGYGASSRPAAATPQIEPEIG